MNIAELVEIALAGTDERRVELAALEPADIAMKAVSSLAQLVAELVDNALEFSGPDDVVRVTGLHEQGDYLISISDRGVGIPEHLMTEMNRLLDDPARSRSVDPGPGISLIARLASRHGLRVRLVPGAPGTTARVTVPGELVGRADGRPKEADLTPTADHSLPPRRVPPDDALIAADTETVDLTRFDHDHRVGSGVIAMTEEGRQEAEAFLEKVFAPLMENPGLIERPSSRPPEDGDRPAEPPGEDATVRQSGTVTDLLVRVPGENFSLVEDDPSTVAAEGAIDIRSALSRYQQGRRSAEEARHQN